MRLCLDNSSFSTANSKPLGDDAPSWSSWKGGREAVAADLGSELVWGEWVDRGSDSQDAH